ncbi:MAG: hypothetical protein QF573_05660 [Chloroflexota bacterium]|nr:hypothetical protein [Chloroflexota bacterium]MDP6508510.1 hypothetical protein [Chloroflexota bacterium]
MNSENRRLRESNRRKRPWNRWGPYRGERQWSTVREDFSAWEHFSFEDADRRAYLS